VADPGHALPVEGGDTHGPHLPPLRLVAAPRPSGGRDSPTVPILASQTPSIIGATWHRQASARPDRLAGGVTWAMRGEAGMGSVNWRKRGRRYQVSWRLDDGSQGSKAVATRDEARELAAAKRLEIASGAWKGRQRGRLTFDRWADDWWAVWSGEPTLSPNSLTMTESRLRTHLRPFFGLRVIEDITSRLLRQWQNQMAARRGHATVMACRSVLFRILQFAEDENAIPANPMRRVAAPKRPVDPDVVLGTAKRRVLAPEEAGVLLAAFPPFWWDHVITLLGCGLRISELAGLRAGRVDLARGVLQVVDTRYQTGAKYGSGFKGPKSAAGVRDPARPPGRRGPRPPAAIRQRPGRAGIHRSRPAGRAARAAQGCRAGPARCYPATTSVACTCARSLRLPIRPQP